MLDRCHCASDRGAKKEFRSTNADLLQKQLSEFEAAKEFDAIESSSGGGKRWHDPEGFTEAAVCEEINDQGVVESLLSYSGIASGQRIQP